ncbi:unnamed protein product [Paramecium sonneborni]|uniref:Uncharacterized protein n=1 Tax=Paramecium sonneborni TaxID=65129 RepID=A0A8S1PAK7_9CILI|nr:unnamed protein product [Paramecium sonneborni]
MNPTFKQSQQLENSSNIMGSSAGFNRKIKLASQRPGSRDQKLKTGEIFPQFQDPLANNPFNLLSLNLYQEENTFISTMKAELQLIQEEINKLDIDGRIRNNDPRQEYRLQQLKKWVAQNSQSKLTFEKLNNIDISQLLTILDVRTLEEAVVKLYKFISIMDNLIMKITELEAIHMIKFDELFGSLCPNYQENLQQISVLKFQISIANLNRMAELYQVKQDKNQSQKISNDNNNNQIMLKQIKQKDDQINDLNKTIKQLQLQLQTLMKGNNNNNNNNNNNQISLEQIEQIRNEYELKLQKQSEILTQKHEKEIETLQSQIEQFQKQLLQLKNHYEKQISDLVSQNQQEQLNIKSQYEDKLQQQQQSQKQIQSNTQSNTQQQNNGVAKDHNYYQKILDKAQQEYNEKYKILENDINKLRNQILEKQTIIESQQREIQQWKETIDRLNKVKDEIYQQFQKRYTTEEQFSNSYEAALKLEFETMKKAFEQKIQKYQLDFESQRRESGKQINEIRIQLEREQETKKLLLNKLSLYS